MDEEVMMRRRSCLLVLAGLMLLSATSALADTLTLKADYWMPFNGDGKAETGYMLDIAKAVFEPLGHKVVYVTTPWEKALAECRSGKCTAVIGASTDDAPDLVYPAEEEGVSQQLFCVKAGSPWRYAGVASLKPIKLGIVKDYAYFKDLDDYLKTNPQGIVLGTGDNPLQSNIAKLVAGELGAVVDDRSVLKYTIARMGLQGKVVIAPADASSAQPGNLYIAFSPANPKSDEYSRALAEGMASLRKSEQLKKILAKYGLTDWK
jgi:polar amino acid transport system substrate-binding protein